MLLMAVSHSPRGLDINMDSAIRIDMCKKTNVQRRLLNELQCCRKVCQRGKSLLADHLEEALYKKSAKGLPQAT